MKNRMRSDRPGLGKTLIETLRTRRKPPSPAGAPPAELPVIASYNVHKCVGRDRKFDPDRTARVIREIDADVIALQEADSRFGERTGLLDLLRLEHETGLVRVPVSAGERAHGFHGNVLLFREAAVRDVHTVRLPGLEPRGALVTELDMKRGGRLRIIAAHLGLLRHSRARQAGALLSLLEERDDCPTVLMGDLNEWRLGQKSSLEAFRKAFGTLPPAVPSFPAGLPVLALDRIIANRSGLVEAVQAHDTALARLASDHLPLKAQLRLPVDDRMHGT